MIPAPGPVPTHQLVWICRRYGGPEVLAQEERPVPKPGPGEVLVRIEATTVTSGDARVRALRLPRGFGPFGRLMLGLTRPRQPVLGSEFVGTVAAIGPGTDPWRPGDEVVGFSGGFALGCHAQYRVMSATGALTARPRDLATEEAAALGFAGTTALAFLRRAGVARGDSVLVLGAAGAVGSALVQLARHAGARVTAVTSSAHLELMQRLGADDVVDRGRMDFHRLPGSFDIVADAVGASTFARCTPLLRDGGRYLAIAADLPGLFARPVGSKRSLAGPLPERPEDFREIVGLAAAGVFRPVVDGVFAFADLPAAHARVDTGRKRGSVVVRVGSP